MTNQINYNEKHEFDAYETDDMGRQLCICGLPRDIEKYHLSDITKKADSNNQAKVTCASLDCPERTGGRCREEVNNQLKEQILGVQIEQMLMKHTDSDEAIRHLVDDILDLIHKRDEEIIQELEKRKAYDYGDRFGSRSDLQFENKGELEKHNKALDEAIEVIRKI